MLLSHILPYQFNKTFTAQKLGQGENLETEYKFDVPAIMMVFEFPPKLSFNNQVRTESL